MPINVETGNQNDGTSASNFNHTLTTKARRMVVIMAGIEQEDHLSALSYGSNSLLNGEINIVASAEATAGAGNFQRMYCILDTDLDSGGGAQTVSASGPGGGEWDIGVIEINDVAQVVPSGANIDTTITGNGNNSISSSCTAQEASVIIGQTGHGTSGQAMTPSGTGTWSTLVEKSGASERFANRYQIFSTAGSKTYTESWGGGGTRSAQIMASFEEDEGGGGGIADPNSMWLGFNFRTLWEAWKARPRTPTWARRASGLFVPRRLAA